MVAFKAGNHLQNSGQLNSLGVQGENVGEEDLQGVLE